MVKIEKLRRVWNIADVAGKVNGGQRIVYVRSHIPEELKELDPELAQRCSRIVDEIDANSLLDEIRRVVLDYELSSSDLSSDFWQECIEEAGASSLIEDVSIEEWLCRYWLDSPEDFEEFAATFVIAILNTLPFKAVAYFNPHISESGEFYVDLIVVEPHTRICLTMMREYKTTILGWTIPLNGYSNLMDLNHHVLEIRSGLIEAFKDFVLQRRN